MKTKLFLENQASIENNKKNNKKKRGLARGGQHKRRDADKLANPLFFS